MRVLLPWVLLAMLCVPAAAEDDWMTPGTHKRTLINDMVERTFWVHVPKGFTRGKPVPMVIALHGMSMNGRQMEILTRFSALGDDKGFAAVYPDAYHGMWDYYRAQAEPWTPKERGGGLDLDFLPAMIDELVDAGLADPTRVYMTGVSNGGFMTNRMAMDIPERLAAVASVCGTLMGKCALQEKVRGTIPVMHMHGTADHFVQYGSLDGKRIEGQDLGAEDLAYFWADKNGCNPKPEEETILEKAKDGTKVERRTYSGGKDGTVVILYRIRGGGHTWPGIPSLADAVLGASSKNLDASATIWEFFSRFTRKVEDPWKKDGPEKKQEDPEKKPEPEKK